MATLPDAALRALLLNPSSCRPAPGRGSVTVTAAVPPHPAPLLGGIGGGSTTVLVPEPLAQALRGRFNPSQMAAISAALEGVSPVALVQVWRHGFMCGPVLGVDRCLLWSWCKCGTR